MMEADTEMETDTTPKTKPLSPKQLFDRQPEPLAAKAGDVEDYISAVQIRYAGSKDSNERKRLRREALSQIELAGVRAASCRNEALDSLNRIFRLGKAPSTPLDGFYRGILVTPAVAGPIDRVLRAATRAYLPWLGKRFDAGNAGGDNLLEKSGRTAAKIIWPRYDQLTPTDEGQLAGFRFKTYAGAGRLDPDRQTLALDYNLEENPGFLVRRVLDELVEVVPGVYLGKMLVRVGQTSWRLAAYFAVTDP